MISSFNKLSCQAFSVAFLALCSALGSTAGSATHDIPDLIEALQPADITVHAKAADELRMLEPAANEHILALIEALKGERRLHDDAVAALSTSEPAALPLLILALSNNDSRVRAGVVDALQRMGLDAKPVVPDLLRAVNDPDPHVRALVLSTLGGLQERACITILIEKLKADKDADVRRAAADALGKVGPAPKDPILALPVPHIRALVVSTLSGPQERACITILIEKLKADKDADVRRAAADALGRFGPAAKEAIPALIEALQDPDDFWTRQSRNPPQLIMSGFLNPGGVQEVAFQALAKMGSGAVPAILEILKNPDRKQQRRAVTILGCIGPEAKDAVPVLVQKLEDEDQQLRLEAALSLGKIGPQAKLAVPALTRALTDRSGEVRVVAAEALKDIDWGNQDALPALIKELRNTKSEARTWAASGLRTVGKGEEAAVTALINALSDGDADVADTAMYSLRDIGPCAQSAVPRLAKALRDAVSVEVRVRAAHLLTEVQDDDLAVPALIDALQADEKKIRNLAARALGAHGSKAEAAIPALTKALADTSLEVRETAAKALEKIRRRQ